VVFSWRKKGRGWKKKIMSGIKFKFKISQSKGNEWREQAQQTRLKIFINKHNVLECEGD
jgi:hypothetical protein